MSHPFHPDTPPSPFRRRARTLGLAGVLGWVASGWVLAADPQPGKSMDKALATDAQEGHGAGSQSLEEQAKAAKRARARAKEKARREVAKAEAALAGPAAQAAASSSSADAPLDRGQELLQILQTSPLAGLRPGRDQLKPGANLAGADLSHLDLSHLDLRGACLVGAKLNHAIMRSTDLRGADLTRADLRHGRMSGAKFQHADLYMADVTGTSGLNLTGASAHPFFAREADETVGAVKLYELPDPSFHPDQILMGSKGDLHLVQKGTGKLWILSATGLALPVQLPGEMGNLRLMARGGGNRVWLFGERETMIMADTCLYNNHRLTDRERVQTAFQVTASAPGRNGEQWVAVPDRVYRLKSDQMASVRHEHWSFPGVTLKSLVVMDDGGMILGAQAKEGVTWFWNRHTLDYGNFKEGSARTEAHVQGEGGFWYLAPNLAEFGFTQLTGTTFGWTSRTALIATEAQQAIQGLGNLTLGPDGQAWFTAQTPPAIGRVSRPGMTAMLWPLEPGLVPDSLTDGKDGCLYFTVAGQALIGRIRATAPPPSAESQVWPVEAYQAKAAASSSSGPTDRERREWAFEQSLGAEEKAQAAGAATAASSASSPTRMAPQPGPSDPEPGRSQRILEDMGLRLSPGDLEHILTRHSHQPALMGSTAGQFMEAFSNDKALPALLVRGLRQAGSIGRVLKRFDPEGLRHTPCHLDTVVGHYLDRNQQWQPTRCFDIVTSHNRIVSAYPINPNKY